jgi:16S rRNA (guanine1207-N2)-methyltransferase
MTRRHRSGVSPRDYHRYRELVFDIGGQQYSVNTKPGIASWDEPDPATQLLMEVMDVNSADRVLDLGCGVGWVGLVVARQVPQGWACLVDRNAVAVEAARRTLALNGALNAEVRLSDCGAALQGQSFDLVVIHAPREREVARQCVRDAAALLRPGGYCYLAGANRSGVKSAIRYLAELLGEAHVLAYRGGSRVALATKGEAAQVGETESREYHHFRELIAETRGKRYVCVTKPGLFSWNKVDEGTRRLVENMEIGPQERALDLGCGYGLAGLVAADMAPQGEVILVDVDCLAVEAARRTLERNEVGHAQVLLSDCGAAVMDRTFDVAITNPPFHQGRGVSYEVARQFIHDAAAVLRPGGRLYLVANRFIPYGREMKGLFQEIGFAYRDSRFQVWKAIKGRR